MRLDAEVKCLQWHPHEALLAIATTRGLHWYEASAQTLTAVSTITAGGRAIDWDHTGQRLAFADGKGVVQIVGRDGELIRSIPKHNHHSYVTVDWHPTEDWIVTGSDELILWSGSGAQLAFIRHRPQNTLVLTAQWHPSGTFFTSGDYGHASEGTPTLLQFWAAGGNLMLQRLDHEKEIRNLRWTKDGRYLATASDGIRIWDPHGKLLFHEHSQDVIWGLSWNPAGTHLITAEFSGRVHIRDHAGRIVHVLYDKP